MKKLIKKLTIRTRKTRQRIYCKPQTPANLRAKAGSGEARTREFSFCKKGGNGIFLPEALTQKHE
ncbi:MAG: hypothetical protein LUD39_03830 [Opitutae bacterium]|nr:hypothetical protein [Opitutae bacterium]MCD8298870.1 hypothetical protein [Opitutae bacterium]